MVLRVRMVIPPVLAAKTDDGMSMKHRVRSSISATTVRNLSKSAPAILVMPADDDVLRADITPPIFKFFTRNVEGRRRDAMVENDRMLFPPVEARDVIQVVVVEQVTRQLLS